MRNNEAYSVTRINAQLLNAGWCLDGYGQNVGQNGLCKTKEQKKKLGGKRPDYILFKSNSDQPLAIIEAKKPNRNLDSALAQGIDYAQRIGAQFVFATDSFVVRMVDSHNNTPTIDGEPIDELLPEDMLIKLLGNIAYETEKTVIESRKELIAIFKKAEKHLRDDGIDVGMDSIYEFCTILFIKIMSETSSKISNPYRWDRLVTHTGEDLYAHYQDTLAHFKSLYKGIFREMKIKSPEVLERIVTLLKDVNLSSIDIDIKGEAYEHFLKRYSAQNKSVLGQHFTPRHITDMMSLLLSPGIDEKTYDPFCGTGGMLLSCYRQMRRNIHDEKDIRKLNENCLFGNDVSFGTSQIAKMNMVLVGDGHSNITNTDSFKNRIDGAYDSVITNIPFNLNVDKEAFKSSGAGSNIACVMHCLDALKKGGRACIIVPENMAYDNDYREFRKYIFENSRIEAIIRLPRHTFMSYTAARTCILWISGVKQKKTESDFVYIDVANDGFSNSQWREPISGSDLPKILENKDDLAAHYAKQGIKDNYAFFERVAGLKTEGDYTLRELLDIKTKKEKIEANKMYNEPLLSSKTNTITTRRERLGKNIRATEKIIIAPGDLVIGTLHTQSGNGLFAISDDYYIAASQIVATVKKDLISVDYLKFALQNVLPKLEVNDLVGRETYSPSEILSLRIPAEPKGFRKDMDKIASLEKEREKIDNLIEEIRSKYRK